MNPDQKLGEEIQELENEISMLAHKLNFMKDKEIQLVDIENQQEDKIKQLIDQEQKMEAKETRMVQKGKRQYGIDFSDRTRILEETEQEKRREEKEQLIKKISFNQSTMESNKKNYQASMKHLLRKQKELEKEKEAVQQQIANI